MNHSLSAPTSTPTPLPRPRQIAPLLPGLLLTTGIAVLAFAVQRGSGLAALSPLVVAMVMGLVLRNTLGAVPGTAPGVAFSLRRILRFAIILLGFQITLGDLADIGPGALAAVVLTLLSTFVFTKLAGRALGVDRKLSELIAAGTSVCGASAVVACNAVTQGQDEDVAYAIACVTVFGSIAMLGYPLLAGPLGLSPQSFGLWAGGTIHEVAQVVAAAFTQGELAGQSGTIAKLSRVMMLAPLIIGLGVMASRRAQGDGRKSEARAPLPWFVFGFIAVVVLNSVIEIPPATHGQIVTATSFLLTIALAAMGLETDVHKLRRKGLRPLLLGALATAFIAVTGLGLILLLA